jgi:hypothetical protein
MRRLLAAAAFLALTAAPLRAQYRGVRFEITSVGDTTFAFSSGGEKWIRRGQEGIAVDPRRRDALVARFRVTAVHDGVVDALVTGQTTNLRVEHVAVLEEPRRSWYRAPSFWAGLATGAALGVSVALLR